jgi:transcriptional regulator with XRE-family HTH domain
MAFSDDMAGIEDRIRANGRSIRQLCIEAGIARSTWDRWRRGETEPNTKTWRAVMTAADVLTTPPVEEDAA